MRIYSNNSPNSILMTVCLTNKTFYKHPTHMAAWAIILPAIITPYTSLSAIDQQTTSCFPPITTKDDGQTTTGANKHAHKQTQTRREISTEQQATDDILSTRHSRRRETLTKSRENGPRNVPLSSDEQWRRRYRRARWIEALSSRSTSGDFNKRTVNWTSDIMLLKHVYFTPIGGQTAGLGGNKTIHHTNHMTVDTLTPG